jgi:cytoskeletal protein CcmA (bactofilin family)
MQHFSRLFPRREETDPPEKVPAHPSLVAGPSNHTFMPTQSGSFLSQGISIKGSVKFLNELFIDGKVKGTIDSTGTLTIGEDARIRGDIRTKSVNVRGTVEGNIFATERCELQASCTLHGDIEATWLVVNENATFRGQAKVGNCKSLSTSRSPAEPHGNRVRKVSQRSRDAVIRVYDVMMKRAM